MQKDLICLNTCLSALASAGEWQKALIFLRQMEGSFLVTLGGPALVEPGRAQNRDSERHFCKHLKGKKNSNLGGVKHWFLDSSIDARI